MLGNGGLGSTCLRRRSLGAVLTRVTALRRVRARHPLVCAVSGRLVIRRVGAGDGVRRPRYQAPRPVHIPPRETSLGRGERRAPIGRAACRRQHLGTHLYVHVGASIRRSSGRPRVMAGLLAFRPGQRLVPSISKYSRVWAMWSPSRYPLSQKSIQARWKSSRRSSGSDSASVFVGP